MVPVATPSDPEAQIEAAQQGTPVEDTTAQAAQAGQVAGVVAAGGAMGGAATVGGMSSVAGGAAPAAVGAAAVIAAADAKAIVATAETALRALRPGGSGGDDIFWLFLALQEEYGAAIPKGDLQAIAEVERPREIEFWVRVLRRLRRDLPKAMKADNRRDAIQKILNRERRYVLWHFEQSLRRARAAVSRWLTKMGSPDGAYWILRPGLEHCATCVAMATVGWWPWEVLDFIHPPAHPNCGCDLLTYKEAVARGLMTGPVPDTAALKDQARALGLLEGDFSCSCHNLEESKWSSGAMVALYPAPEVAVDLALPNGEPPKELHVTLAYLGKADELGDPSGVIEAVKSWALSSPKFDGEISGYGHFVGGPDPVTYASVDLPDLPDARQALVADLDQTTAPAKRNHGFTPHITLDYGRRRPKIDQPIPVCFEEVHLVWGEERYVFPLNGDLEETALELEELRWDRRFAKGTMFGGQFRPERGGFSPRLSLSDVLRDLFPDIDRPASRGERRSSLPNRRGSRGDVRKSFRAKSGLTERGGQRSPVSVPAPVAPPPQHIEPVASRKVIETAIGQAQEYAAKRNIPTFLTSVAIDTSGDDTEGFRDWNGNVTFGPGAEVALADLERARVEQRAVSDETAANSYNAYRVINHEILHTVNPQTAEQYEGSGQAIEEALVEELAHANATEQLTADRQYDVLRWMARQPDDPRVRGLYQPQRAALRAVLDAANVALTDRRAVLEMLKYNVAPDKREGVLAGMVAAANPGMSRAEALDRVTSLMASVDPDIADPLAELDVSILAHRSNADHRMVVHVGTEVRAPGAFDGKVVNAGYDAEGGWELEIEVLKPDGTRTYRYRRASEVEVLTQPKRDSIKGERLTKKLTEGDTVAVEQLDGSIVTGTLRNAVPAPHPRAWQAELDLGADGVVPLNYSSVREVSLVKAAKGQVKDTRDFIAPPTPKSLYREAAIKRTAAAAHEAWRKTIPLDTAGFPEPRYKPTADKAWKQATGQPQVDIANTSFENLPADWQRELKEGAASAIDAILAAQRDNRALDIDELASEVHDAWLDRNPDAPKETNRPYADLTEEQKDNDRSFVNFAMEALGVEQPKIMPGYKPFEDPYAGDAFDPTKYANPHRPLIRKAAALPPGHTLHISDGTEITRGKHGDAFLVVRPDGKRRRYATASRMANAEIAGVAERHGVERRLERRPDEEKAIESMILPGPGQKSLFDLASFAPHVGQNSPNIETAKEHVASVAEAWDPESREAAEPVAQELDEAVKAAALSTRTTPDRLMEILDGGKFVPSTESGRSAPWREARDPSMNEGYDELRIKEETQLFGASPFYGYFVDRIGTPVDPDWYGNVRVDFKDSVKDRTTYTGEDSLHGTTVPTPVGQPNPLALAIEDYTEYSGGGTVRSYLEHTGTGYVEAQIFGDRPTTDEIEKVVLFKHAGDFPHQQGSTDELKEALEAAGIPWEQRNKWGAVDDGSEQRRRRSAIRAMGQSSPGTSERWLDPAEVYDPDTEIPAAAAAWIEDLDGEEEDAALRYVETGHPAPFMEEDPGELKRWWGHLDRAARKGSLPEDTTLWRGISSARGKDIVRALEKDGVWNSGDQLLSTTTDEGTGVNFGHVSHEVHDSFVVLEIEAPAGAAVGFPSPANEEYFHEREVLLPSNTTLRLIDEEVGYTLQDATGPSIGTRYRVELVPTPTGQASPAGVVGQPGLDATDVTGTPVRPGDVEDPERLAYKKARYAERETELAEALGLKVIGRAEQEGLWVGSDQETGEAYRSEEPSFITRVEGPVEAINALRDLTGEYWQQDGMIRFTYDDDAKGGEFRMNLPDGVGVPEVLEAIEEELGPDHGASVRGGQVILYAEDFDEGGELADKLGERFGVETEAYVGEFALSFMGDEGKYPEIPEWARVQARPYFERWQGEDQARGYARVKGTGGTFGEWPSGQPSPSLVANLKDGKGPVEQFTRKVTDAIGVDPYDVDLDNLKAHAHLHEKHPVSRFEIDGQGLSPCALSEDTDFAVHVLLPEMMRDRYPKVAQRLRETSPRWGKHHVGQRSPSLPFKMPKLFGGDNKPTDEAEKKAKEAEKAKSIMEAPPSPVLGIPDYDTAKLTDSGPAGGSNDARIMTDQDGFKWILKAYRGDQDRVATELLANALYRELGIGAPIAGTSHQGTGDPDFTLIPDETVEEPPFPEVPKGMAQSTGVVVVDEKGDVLIFEPKNHFGGYEWTFPKGRVEEGLTPQQNAHKELWEETGARAKITGYLGDYKGDVTSTRYYVAELRGSIGPPGRTDETESVKRASIEKAGKLLNRSRDQKILKDIAALELKADKKKRWDKVPSLPRSASTDKVAIAMPFIKGEERPWHEPNEALAEGFVADALTANWDVVGMGMDNVLWDGDVPYRVDQGGTLEYRARGGLKDFGPVPTELWTMNQPGGQAFGKMKLTEEGMRAAAKDAELRLTPERIDKLVNEAPYTNEEMRERVRQNLKERVAWLGRYSRGEVGPPEPLEGKEVADRFAERDEEFILHPEEDDALEKLFADSDIDKALQSRTMVPELKDPIDALDKLFREPALRTTEDFIGYTTLPSLEAIGAKSLEDAAKKYLKDPSFLRLDVEPGAYSPVRVRVTVPAGIPALWPEEGEGVVLPRDMKLKIVGGQEENGVTVLEAVVTGR